MGTCGSCIETDVKADGDNSDGKEIHVPEEKHIADVKLQGVKELVQDLIDKLDDDSKLRMERLEQATYAGLNPEMYSFTKCKIIKVYDGDTFWIAAWHRGVLERHKVRLWGADTPELNGGKPKVAPKTEEEKEAEELRKAEEKRKALLAKQFVVDLIDQKIVTIDVLNNKRVNRRLQTPKYFRLLGKITLDDGTDLADALMKAGHAKEYYGGTKE